MKSFDNDFNHNDVESWFPEYKSVVRGIVFPSIPVTKLASTMAVVRQLEESQWWPAEKLQENQFKQLSILLEHAYRNCLFYRKRLEEVQFSPGTPISEDAFTKIPLLIRNELQHEADSLLCTHYPKGHGKTLPMSSSGSTGTPVTVKQSELSQFFYNVFSLRDYLWHQRDFRKKLASIKTDLSSNPGEYPHGKQSAGWGVAGFVMGESWTLKIDTPISKQKKWLDKLQPDYLLTYPTNLDALADLYAQEGTQLPGLKQISTLGEPLDDEVIKKCRKIFNVDVTDLYSCQEIGILASRCPDSLDRYHIHSENVLIEIINEDGTPCSVGEIGKVIVTDLHNFVMPLIRYELGDYAEVGEMCGCKRGLPVIRKIAGRKRNLLTLPNGDKYWPMLGLMRIAKEVDKKIRQLQVIQKSLSLIEVRIGMDGSLKADKEDQVKKIIQDMLNYSFDIEVVYMNEIQRSKSGKYEDFISEVK